MKILLVGGTGFTGPVVVQELVRRGHEVTIFHRGQTYDDRTIGCAEILGDRKDPEQLAEAVAHVRPRVAVDMIPFTTEDATGFVRACHGVVSRVVALSSIDVYLAFGRIKMTEPGPIQPTPLVETSALRETNQPSGPQCDKIAVENVVRNAADLPATILRLPAIYGRGDKYRRFRCYLKRMDDGRGSILLGSSVADWKFSRGYVDNVAHAVVLAIELDHAAGEVFNVAEQHTFKERDLVEAIGIAADWQGTVKVIPDDRLPEHLRSKENFRQDWAVATTKIRRQLGYREIVGVEESLRRTVVWERENPPDTEPYVFDYEAEDRAIADLG